MIRSFLIAAVLAFTAPALSATAQEPPEISVTEAHLLSTFGAPGAEDPYWVFTLQHFSTWRYGSNFFFVDLADSPGLEFYEGEPGLYLEYAPVFSLGRLGIVRTPAPDVLRDIGATLQVNTGWTPGSDAGPFPINRVFLEGVDLAWAVPGFAVFNTQLLARQERGYNAGWQVTWIYTLPFSIGTVDAMVTGFLDIWGRYGGAESDHIVLLAQPQLLANVTESLQVGVELEPSRNFPNTLTSDGWNVAYSPMVRWVF